MVLFRYFPTDTVPYWTKHDIEMFDSAKTLALTMLFRCHYVVYYLSYITW